ncbi:hypothetical protein GCM10027059_15830 [Myceligenerans halotolerans]
MNSNLPERDDADFLAGALHGAADAMPGGETEEMHLQFGVVRDRVHRRRATKIGGIGAMAFAVAGGLAVGAAQLTPFGDEALLPADPSASDSATSAPSPTAQDTSLNGYVPSEIYLGTPLACGLDEEVVPRFADDYSIRFEGPPYRVGEGDTATAYAGLELQELPKSGGGTLDLEPAAVWIRDGEVVNLSRYFDPEPPGVTYDEAGLARTDIRLDPVNACDPPEGVDVSSSEPVEYEHVLAAGEYQVVPVLWTEVIVGAANYVTGEPMVVEVLSDGTVATERTATGIGESREPSGGASGDPGDVPSAGAGDPEPGDGPGECSAAGLDDTSDFSFEPDPVARTAQALVDAALACDLLALEEIEEPGVTQLHRAAEVSVAERFALPEEGDDVYAKLATLLSGVAVVDPETGNYVWPTVASPEYQDDPVAWDYAVELGFATPAQADEWRAAGGAYHGWRMSIEPDGTWRTFLGPDQGQ